MQAVTTECGAFRSFVLGALGAVGIALGATAVHAQGINPGDAEKDAYTLPYGILPVLQLRTYYFGSESLTGSKTAAWALGGWAGLRSPWLGDVFQLGVVGYTSQKLHGPADEGGTRLLTSA